MGILNALGLKREEYLHKVKAEWSEWDAQVERDRAERKRNLASLELDRDEDFETYQARREEANIRLADLQNASEDKWEDMQTGVEKAWLDVKNVFQKIRNRVS